MRPFDLAEGTPVVLYLHGPREKVWGVLLGLTAAGVMLRGIELDAFEDFMRQEVKGEEDLLGLVTAFYPMHRVDRLERDETVGPVLGYADRFAREVGRTIFEVIGLETGGD
ncbi:MAG TPA: hypothetical protein VFM88_11075 [Vicinamibacteria bacterium]|nr:hypothetical protein [Vicinamibacteria bacterium]